MPRPCKRRRLSCSPGSVTYKPAGIPANSIESVILQADEYEAIHMLDYLGYDQEKTAEKMKVSRPTVTRIYARARKKIALALTEGKAIVIETYTSQEKCCNNTSGNGQKRRRRGNCHKTFE